jgi:hypothetical protein
MISRLASVLFDNLLALFCNLPRKWHPVASSLKVIAVIFCHFLKVEHLD